jgi:hypothetical protein
MYHDGVASNGIKFLSDFEKIGQLVQNLKWDTCAERPAHKPVSFLKEENRLIMNIMGSR